jgi:hypothetical protein
VGTNVDDNSNYFRQTAPAVVAPPFTVGMWIKPNAATNECSWALGGTGASVSYRIFTSGGGVNISNHDGTTGTNAQIASPAVVTGAWMYVVARVMSTTNRKISAVTSVAGVQHASSVTSATAPTCTQMSIGTWYTNASANQFSGHIAEFFFADVDVQGDGAQLTDELVMQLAFRGPWSVSHLVPRILEYISFRSVVAPTGGIIMAPASDFYQKGATSRPWTNTVAATLISDHPPLYDDYVRPNQIKKFVPI